MEEKKNQVRLLKEELARKKLVYPVDGVCSFNINGVAEEVQSFRNELVTYDRNVKELLNTHSADLGEANVQQIQEENNAFMLEIVQHISALQIRASEVQNTVNGAANSANRVGGSSAGSSQNSSNQNDPDRAVEIATKRATDKARDLISDLNKLVADFTKIEAADWVDASDLEVENGMKSIPQWLSQMKEHQKLFREAKDIINQQNMALEDIPDLQEAKRRLNETSFQLNEVKSAIEFQEETRELYTNKTATTEKISYPSFEGKDDESFHDFKNKVEKCFKQNRVRREDKVAKLRDLLKGHAKKLIPENQKCIDSAWESLENAYGNSIKLMNHRLKQITSLSRLPRNNGKNGVQAVVEWYLSLEVIIQGIIDLAESCADDEEITYTLHNPKIVRTIAGLFAYSGDKNQEIMNSRGSGITKLTNCLSKISRYREAAQDLLLTVENFDRETASGKNDTNVVKSKPDKSKVNFVNVKLDNCVPNLPSLVYYNPPQPDYKCRICKWLESQGDTVQLYNGHHSNYPTGCPRFICMTTSERYHAAIQAKYCPKCLDPAFISSGKKSSQNHSKNCPMRPNSKFRCPQKGCDHHLWVCKIHKDKNGKVLQKISEEIKSRHNLELAIFCGTLSQLSIITVPDDDSDVEILNPPPASVPAPTSTAASASKRRKSSSDAFNELQKQLESRKVKSKLRPLNPGAPQFILGYTKGLTRPLLTLYDTGCYGVLFREGVPEKELGPAVMKTKGPIYVNGVGNTNVRVNDEWMCSVQLFDSTRAVLEGLTVDEITAPLPMTKLKDAEKAIKNDSKDPDVKKLSCYDYIGGMVDILLGVAYNNIFPTALHTLESGLTIYKLKIASHDKTFTATLGGSHESFGMMANFCGNLPAFLTQLQAKVDNYNKFGPPRLSAGIVSAEDELFALQFNEYNVDGYSDQEIQQVLSEDLEKLQDEAESDDEEQARKATNSLLEPSGYSNNSSISDFQDCVETVDVRCKDCDQPLQYPANLSRSENEENFMLKSLQKAMEDGLSIEYRCPKCRNCVDCRNSYETERISMREEAEDLMIKDSVKIDWEKKVIECSLPVRGDEEEFLSSNREIAVKILQQQCKKYHQDQSTKEIILKAFDKLLKNKHMIMWDDLDEEDRKMIEAKPVNHYIVWRVVFKLSLSSPARPVFDGSSKTKMSSSGSGGRCLNDLVVKGRIVTLNLTKMVLRFCVGPVACQGDLKQFYASIKLNKNQWNLQRVLFKPDLDPNSEALEAVIVTLIWGIKCVSAQSEAAVGKLAEAIQDKNPRLAEMLKDSRFVDDLGDSAENIELIKSLCDDADELFAQVGLSCKGWTVSGSDPPEDVAEEGNRVGIGGMKWHPKMDFLEVLIPHLHFAKKSRGRLEIGAEVFQGHFKEDLEEFVPKQLTRRMILSKKASLFDVLGKLTPISAKLSLDLRRAIKETSSWDEAVSDQLRSKWIGNFLLLEKIRGYKFPRAKMPVDAKSPKMDLIIAGDTAKDFVLICGVWCRFELNDGSYSCQHLISRSLLGDEDSSIPKEELQALTMASNLGWVVRNMLEKWINDYIVISDSTISICWARSDKKRMSILHRARVVQIRRGTDLEKLYHVISSGNPCDLGTRPEAVTEADVGPQSKWDVGLPWMRRPIVEAVDQGILKPASKLSLNKSDEDDFNKGFIHERGHEILTPGHVAQQGSTDPAGAEDSVLIVSAKQVQERLEKADYLFNPAKFSFEKTVKIMSIINKFIKSFKCLKGKLSKSNHKFSMIPPNENIHVKQGVKAPIKTENGAVVEIGDEEVSKSLEYFFKKATVEVKLFQKPEFIKKVAIEKDGILFNKSRILDGQRLQVAAGLEDLEFLSNFGPNTFGFNLVCPVLDKSSPLAIAIAKYIHDQVYKHRGFESSFRFSLDFCFIIEGLKLFREIGEDCIKCSMLRGKYLKLPMGPLPDESFTVAPPFYCSQVDLFGPCHVYVPGHAMKTRHKNVVEVKCYVLCFVDLVTKCVNLQVIENKAADGIIDGINRMCCEVGVPKIIFTDQDTGIMKALGEVDVTYKDLQQVIYKEKGILFKTCPVQGHNFHGLAEKKIHSVQECLQRMEIEKMRLHATGYQTLMKLIENDLNNLPFGYCYGRKSDNSPLLKLVFPNLLRIGRNNSRALDGPIKIPKNPGDLVKRVNEAYSTFYNLWNTVIIPKLMKAPKWFDQSENLKIGEIVYFQKVENEMKSSWSLGKIVDVVMSKDGVVRRATVEYQNNSENVKRTTDRAARSLIKLFHIDDQSWYQEMTGVERILDNLKSEMNDSTLSDGSNTSLGVKLAVWVKSAKNKCKNCCCNAHCLFDDHNKSAKTPDVQFSVPDVEFQFTDRSEFTADEMFATDSVVTSSDGLTALVSCSYLDLELDMVHEDCTQSVKDLEDLL